MVCQTVRTVVRVFSMKPDEWTQADAEAYVYRMIEVGRGHMCLKDGRPADAMRHYDQVLKDSRGLKDSPGLKEALIAKSNVLMGLGMYSEADASLDRLLEIEESDYVYVKKGVALFCLNKYPDALRCFVRGRRALSLVPGAGPCYVRLLFGTRQYRECLKNLNLCPRDKSTKKLEKECRKSLGLIPRWMFWSCKAKTLRDLKTDE